MDNANLNTIEFVHKHTETTNTQTILESSGSGNETLWDLRLVPSSDGRSGSFAFRLNKSLTGSLAIATNAFSMSSDFVRISDGQLWNVMLQRMTLSNTGDGINEYRLHTTLQQEDRIKVYNYITMSVSGATSASVRDSNFEANSNWFSTGSRHILSSSNLDVGNSMSGSIAEIRTWTTALSSSKFRLHTLDKFSTVGNNVNAYKDELVYHFKLNENYASSSISGSQSTVTIVDANPLGPSSTPTNYSFGVNSGIVSSSILYGYDLIDVYKHSKKLMPLIHLPVQSGSNKILSLMNRKHTIEEFLRTYERIKKINPFVEFSSDFIIAYPGEEEKDFMETLNLIKKVKFINSYSFIFSPRPGTVAGSLQTIDKKISVKRLEKVQEVLFDNQIEKNKSLENKIINVLSENQTEDKTKIFGRSEYMTPVIFDGNKKDVGKILKIKIYKSNRNTLFGKAINNIDQKVA